MVHFELLCSSIFGHERRVVVHLVQNPVFESKTKISILFRRIRDSKSTLCSKFWKFSKTKFTSRLKWGQTNCVRSRIWTVQTIHRIKLTNIMVSNISKLKIRSKLIRFQFQTHAFKTIFGQKNDRFIWKFYFVRKFIKMTFCFRLLRMDTSFSNLWFVFGLIQNELIIFARFRTFSTFWQFFHFC